MDTLNTFPGCRITFGTDYLRFVVEDKKQADEMLENQGYRLFAKAAKAFNFPFALVDFLDRDEEILPYQILATMSEETETDAQPLPDSTLSALNFRRLANLRTSHPQILEALKQEYLDGNIVILTSHRSNICLYTSNKLTVERAVWTPAQFRNYDYLRSWRGADPTLEQYFNPLMNVLDRDGYAPGVNYRLMRPGDGALVEYQTDYFRIVGGWDDNEEEIRVGVSRPQDYRVLAVPGIRG